MARLGMRSSWSGGLPIMACSLGTIILAAVLAAGIAPAAAQLAPSAPAPSAPTAAGQPVDTAADIAFWNSVKDSKSTAEINAYLQRFPNGTFADLARLRVKALEQAAQTPPPAAPRTVAPSAAPIAPVGDAPAPTDPGTIREVQAKLYNLNYEVGAQNGLLSTETMDAIRRWQGNVGRRQTGTLTVAELAALRSATIPTVWGALAHAAGGASSAIWASPSRSAASDAAMAGCKRNGGSKCRVVTAVGKGCGAVAHYVGVVGSTRHSGSFAVVRPSLAEATSAALDQCRSQARVPNNCGIKNIFCADGGHKSN